MKLGDPAMGGQEKGKIFKLGQLLAIRISR
jgi:hypothetical protein